jgi:hypothetical protein
MIAHAILMFNIMGLAHFDLLSESFIYGWVVALVIIAGSFILFRSKMSWRIPVVWLVCAALACSPGLSLVRTNLLFFPITFITLFFVSSLSELGRISRFTRLLSTTILGWGLLGGFYVSTVTAQSFHPYSAVVVAWNSEFIYGPYSAKATIPAQRRDIIVEQLAAIGITSADDVNERLPWMVRQAIIEHRRLPGPGEALFVPRLRGLLEP